MSSPKAAPAPTTPPAPPNATSPPPAVSAPPPVPSSPPPVPSPPAPVATPPVPSPPAPVATPPPTESPPAPVTPATPPPADSPPSPPSSSPPPPPPSSSPSPPSPPHSPPPPSGGRSSPPPSGRSPPAPRSSNAPPATPTTPSSNGGGGGGGGVKTPTVVGVAIAAVAVIILISLIFIFCRKKKRRGGYQPHDYLGPPSGPKVDPYGGHGYQWQNQAPPGNHHAVSMPPLNPPPGGASRPPYSPLMSSGGSNYSGSENSQPQPPPPPSAYGFAKSTFTYEELAKATDGFSDANLLGQGGFGYVHKGVLPKEGTKVAIKQLKAGSGQGEREFQAEVEIISRVHHKHLVTLVGYCITGLQRLLVYEFVPNNTLEFHLHSKNGHLLDWPNRMRIALGSAKGLAYLHEDCHPKIIHRDIKAANILIDDTFEAKVADFGLAKLTSDLNTHVSTRVMGTFGYLAPEYANSGKLTDKSDVFSFGVVLLELITGLRPVDPNNDGTVDSLIDWVNTKLPEALQDQDYSELVDDKLQNNYNKSEMTKVVKIASACVKHSAKQRPRMSQVVRALEGDVSLHDVGIRPGPGSVYSSHGSSDYDTMPNQEDMKRFQKTAFADGATSEHWLNPSGSSSEAATTREMLKKDHNSQ